MPGTSQAQAKLKAIAPLPRHVAIIMDGNGRWARQRGWPRVRGHRSGTDNIRNVVDWFGRYGVPYLTLYAFSTENWARPEKEVKGLFSILAEVIDRESIELHRKGVRLRHMGRLERLSPEIRDKVHKAIRMTKGNTRLNLSIAFDYGGRAEIVEAVRGIVRDGIPPEDVTEDLISSRLYIADVPEPDLIIRTGGEMRISNFLIWQSAYSEYYSTSTLWPDFGAADIEDALLAYAERERRYGGLSTKADAESG